MLQDWSGGDGTDGVFVEVFADFGHVEAVVTFLADGNNPCFNIKVSSEFSTH